MCAFIDANQKPMTRQQEESEYNRIQKQGMSDQGIVSIEDLIKVMKGVKNSIFSDSKYHRDASEPSLK